MYTAIDTYSQKSFPCGYLIDTGKLYLPRGTPISKIESITNTTANYIQKSDPKDKMSKQYNALYEPRDKLQEDSIKFLIESKNHQLALNTLPGTGKSFMVTYAITKLNERALIITHNEGLKQQWIIKTFLKMFNYDKYSLMNIAGSNIMEGIVNDDITPADIYFVNHQTLRSYLTAHNGYMLNKFFKKLNIGIKVYDESHLEFYNIMLMDNFSNTNRTWYLTATFDRSDRSESVCFKRAFNSVTSFGEFESKEVLEKHVIYHVVNINSHINPRDRYKVMGFSGMGMTNASYGNYAFFEDSNQTTYNVIKVLIKKIEELEGKILIFVPLIDAVDDVAKKIKIDFPGKSVGIFHSKVSKSDKEDAIKKDIIVSTIKSCGTGRDIPGLRSIISTEVLASKVAAEQLIGRLRPYAKDKYTYFFDVVNISIPACNGWFRSRFKKIQTLVKEVVYLSLDE
jgi:superfamily II DNA or RNA helicase